MATKFRGKIGEIDIPIPSFIALAFRNRIDTAMPGGLHARLCSAFVDFLPSVQAFSIT